MIMELIDATATNTQRPTLCERINALAQHRPLYENIDKHPQSGVYNRFGKNWPMILYYVEGEVHRCRDAVDEFIWERAPSLTEEELKTEFAAVMEKFIAASRLHGMFHLFHFYHNHVIDDGDSEGSEGDDGDGIGTGAFEGVYGRL
jgi:hypothetical protein